MFHGGSYSKRTRSLRLAGIHLVFALFYANYSLAFNCLISLPRRPLAQVRHEERGILRDLIKFALPEDQHRKASDETHFREYKNKEGRTPKVWSLSWEDTEKASAPGLNMSEYERKVLLMRKGDTIEVAGKIFGKHKITLGKFLGAGNAFHAYEVEGSPGLVVKVPFIAENLMPRTEASCKGGFCTDLRGQMTAQIGFLQNLNHALSYSYVARLRKTYDGGLVTLQDRVNGSMNGRAFRQKYGGLIDVIKTLGIEPMKFELLNDPGLNVYGLKSPAELDWIIEAEKKLVKAIGLVDKGDETYGISKNFVYDTNLKDWVLVDGSRSIFTDSGVDWFIR